MIDKCIKSRITIIEYQHFFSFRYMFVTDWGDYAKIERFNMDGTGGVVIVKSGIKWPFCITVDMKTHLVYWGDASLSKIEYMTMDGKNRHVIRLSNDVGPYYLSAFNNEIFWSDAKTNIFSCNKDDISNIKTIDKIGGKPIRPFDLKIYSKEKQPDGMFFFVYVYKCV